MDNNYRIVFVNCLFLPFLLLPSSKKCWWLKCIFSSLFVVSANDSLISLFECTSCLNVISFPVWPDWAISDTFSYQSNPNIWLLLMAILIKTLLLKQKLQWLFLKLLKELDYYIIPSGHTIYSSLSFSLSVSSILCP